MRRALGILLLIAGFAVIATAYLTAPSPSACNAKNVMSLELGQPPSCSTTPPPIYFIAAATLLLLGLLLALPWSRWLTTPD